MYRKLGTKTLMAAGLAMVCGCVSLSNHPLFHKKTHDCPTVISPDCEVGPVLDGCQTYPTEPFSQLPPPNFQGPLPNVPTPAQGTPRLVPTPQGAPMSQYQPKG